MPGRCWVCWEWLEGTLLTPLWPRIIHTLCPAGFDATHSVKGEKARKKGNQISVLGRCSGTGHRPVMVPMSWAASCPERAAVWPSLGQEGMSSGRRNLTGGGLSLSIPAAMGWGPQGVGVRNTSLDRAPWPVAVTAGWAVGHLEPETPSGWGMPKKSPVAQTPCWEPGPGWGAHQMLRAGWGVLHDPGALCTQGRWGATCRQQGVWGPQRRGSQLGESWGHLCFPGSIYEVGTVSPSGAAGAGFPQPLPLVPWRWWGHSCGHSDSVSLWASLCSSAVPQPPLPPACLPLSSSPPGSPISSCFFVLFCFVFLERSKRCHGEASAVTQGGRERRGWGGGGWVTCGRACQVDVALDPRADGVMTHAASHCRVMTHRRVTWRRPRAQPPRVDPDDRGRRDGRPGLRLMTNQPPWILFWAPPSFSCPLEQQGCDFASVFSTVRLQRAVLVLPRQTE